MQFQTFLNYEILSQKAAKLVINFIQKKPQALLCVATGNSPKRTYELLAEYEKFNPGFFKNISIIQLDEWTGLSENDEESCAYFIQNQIVKPLNVNPENVFFFNGKAENPNTEIEKANRFSDSKNGIDLCILGMGKNGHLGFNEPDDKFSKRTHLVKLKKETQTHSMVENLDKKPQFGITLGMEDILNSKKVILIVTGEGKTEVFEKFKTGKTDSRLPVSVLWGHSDAICLIDSSYFIVKGET